MKGNMYLVKDKNLEKKSYSMAKSSDTEQLESLLKTTGQMAYQRDETKGQKVQR